MAPPSSDVLGQRALNRAILARQLLLERADLAAADTVELLVGMQAQVPRDPYLGLWSRLEGFRPEALASLLVERAAVRAPLMRATIHLATARDCRLLRPALQPVLERAFSSGSPFGKRLSGVDLDELTRVGRALVEERPRTRAELRVLLGERWPERDADAMAYAISYLVPLVQVTPRGLWETSGQATWTTIESWLGEPLEPEPSIDDVILRYLGAFGPASAMDMQTWSGLTRLRERFDRLRPRLRVFRSEAGKLLFDLPDAPRPDPATPAPPRFLPEYDNILLSHADRSRMGDDEHRKRLAADWVVGVGGVLVDGFLRGTWRIERAEGAATLVIRPVAKVTKKDRAAVSAEGRRLLAFAASDADRSAVRWVPPVD